MNLKKKLIVSLIIGGIAASIAGCVSDSVSGKGEIVEFDKKEVKQFMNDKKTGFIYISVSEEDKTIKKYISKVLKEEKVDVYDFDLIKSKVSGDTSLSEYGVNNSIQTLGFYQKGKLKEEIDLRNVEKNELSSTIKTFISDMKGAYLE